MKRSLIAAVVFMLAGQGVMPVNSIDDGGEEMALFLMSEKESTCVQVCRGRVFALRFLTTPGTGYGWEFASDPEKSLLEFIGKKVEESESGRRGGSVFVIWTFRALAVGETEISLKYVRPWEKDVEPVKKHVFAVEIR
jgi:predicted secreted protein